MVNQPAMTLAIEPSLIFDQATNASGQQLAKRLREYANLNLISIVFVLREHDWDQLIASARQFEFHAPLKVLDPVSFCLLYTSPSPRDKRQSRMPSSA